MRAFPLDPSLDGAKLGSKAGFDLTVPFGAGDNPEFSVPDTPRFVVAKTAATVEEALTRCPQTFFELMVALGTQDGRDILRSFDDLRAKGRLKRLDDGKYALKDA
jgi:hypothetical protein